MIRTVLLCCFLMFAAGTLAQSNQNHRLVILAPDLAENVAALGAEESIVGVISGADYPASIRDIPEVGDHQLLNYEAILALEPNMVFGWSGGNPERQLAHLESLGLRVERFESQKLDDLPRQLRRMGALLGKETEAELQAAQFEHYLAELRSTQREDTVSLVYLIWDDPLLTVNGSSWISEAIELCGAKHLFADERASAPQLSVESILAAQPQILIASDELAENWRDRWTSWTGIPAVSENRLYTVEADTLHRLTLRIRDGIAELCRVIDQVQSDYES